MSLTEIPKHLLSLPSEILCQIFYLSREPAFLHVCRRIWKDLPSFIWYSKRLTALALYKAITDHVYSEDAVEFPALLTLPAAEYPLPEGERVALQEQLFCSYWFTEKHLIHVSHDLMLTAIRVALGMLDINLTPLQATQLRQAVEKVHQNWKEGQAVNIFRCHTRWYAANDHGVPGFDIDLYGLTLVIRGSNVDRHGKKVMSWRQQDQHLSADSINIPILSSKLIEQVFHRSERSLRLLSALYAIRTDPYMPRPNLTLPLMTRIAIDMSVRRMLGEQFHLANSDDRYLRLMLLFDNYRGPADSACSHKMRTQLEKDSIWIDERHYEAVIREGNTNGLRCLLKLNPGTCKPNTLRMKKMLSEARNSGVPSAKESLNMYNKARQKALVARQELYANTRNGLISKVEVGKQHRASMTRSIQE